MSTTNNTILGYEVWDIDAKAGFTSEFWLDVGVAL